jgi:transposase-like protein
MTRVEKAIARHTSGFGCPVCGSVFSEELGIDGYRAKDGARPGGGIGRQGRCAARLAERFWC